MWRGWVLGVYDWGGEGARGTPRDHKRHNKQDRFEVVILHSFRTIPCARALEPHEDTTVDPSEPFPPPLITVCLSLDENHNVLLRILVLGCST